MNDDDVFWNETTVLLKSVDTADSSEIVSPSSNAMAYYNFLNALTFAFTFVSGSKGFVDLMVWIIITSPVMTGVDCV